MVSDLEFEFDDHGNITRATLEVHKMIDAMDEDDMAELMHDFLHLRYHIMCDELDIVKRANSMNEHFDLPFSED